MTDRKVCLDLFSGLGGFSAAFEDAGDWQVVTVDLDPDGRFDPDLRADVLDLRPSDFSREFDVVLASPPCTQFSPAQNLNGPHEPAGDAVALVYHALGLIHGLNPTYWFLENPRGRLRSYLGRPTGSVTYCQYGEANMKPTDLWGDHPQGFTYRSCAYGNPFHVNHRDGSNPMRDDLGKPNPAERAKVPYGLSAAIHSAVEDALSGPTWEQASIGEVTRP